MANSGIEVGAFDGLSTLYIGIAEAKLTSVPKGKTSQLYDQNVQIKPHCNDGGFSQ